MTNTLISLSLALIYGLLVGVLFVVGPQRGVSRAIYSLSVTLSVIGVMLCAIGAWLLVQKLGAGWIYQGLASIIVLTPTGVGSLLILRHKRARRDRVPSSPQ